MPTVGVVDSRLVARRLLWLRYLLLAAVAAAFAVPAYIRTSGQLGDFYLLVWAGRAMTGQMPGYHTGALHVYAFNGAVQIGPPTLLLLGGLCRVSGRHAQEIWSVLAVACGVGVVRAVESTAVSLGATRQRAAVGALCGGSVLLAGWSHLLDYYHLEDAVAVLAVALTVAAIAKRRPWWVAALLVGFAAACKPWGVMFFPLLLALPRHAWFRAALAALGMAVVWWVPFVVADQHTVTSVNGFATYVSSHAGLRGLGWQPAAAPPGLRLMEFAVGISLGGLAVLRGRWLAVPLMACAARALLDPRWFAYYGVAPVAAALLLDLTSRRRVPTLTITTATLEWGVVQYAPPQVGATVLAAFGVATVGWLLLAARSGQDDRTRLPVRPGAAVTNVLV